MYLLKMIASGLTFRLIGVNIYGYVNACFREIIDPIFFIHGYEKLYLLIGIIDI